MKGKKTRGGMEENSWKNERKLLMDIFLHFSIHFLSSQATYEAQRHTKGPKTHGEMKENCHWIFSCIPPSNLWYHW